MDAGQPSWLRLRRRIGWKPAVVLAALLTGCSQLAVAQYRLLGAPGETIPLHTHFPGLCPGSSLTLCPARLGLRSGFEVKPIGHRDGWTLVQYDLHAQHQEGWVEGTRVRYLADNIHVSKAWSPATAHLAYEFRHGVTEVMGWAPEGSMPTSAEDIEMAKVAGWRFNDENPWRIMPTRIKGQRVSIVAVNDGGSCSAMDTQVWSRNLSKMLGPKETPKGERDYPFYSGRVSAWTPQFWSGPVLINGKPYRVDINFSLGEAFVLSKFGAGFEPVQTLFDIPVLKQHPKLVYCASKTICNAITEGNVNLIRARHVYGQPTSHLKTFHWDEQIVADMGSVKSSNGQVRHLGIAQETFVSSEGCGYIEERQWPLIEQSGRKLVLNDAGSKRLMLKFTHLNINSKTLLYGNGVGNIRVEFVRIDGKLLIERLAGVPPQLPGSATYWRLERDGKFKRVAEFSPIYRRLTIPLNQSTD